MPFEDFRGDFRQLATVMQDSWATNVTPPFLYSADFLADRLTSPGATFTLAPSLYRKSDLVAFVAGFPRSVRVCGRELRLLIVAFLTVSVDSRNRGYGILVWSELVQRAREAGFDGIVNYCVEGEAMHRMIEGTSRRLDLPVERVFTVEYLTRVLFPRSPVATAASARPSTERFLDAAEAATHGAELARIWTRDEVAAQLDRLDAVEAHVETERRGGYATGYVMSIGNRDRTRCLVVDDVLWHDLGHSERDAVVDDLVAAGVAAGARIAVIPIQGFADLQPFVSAGFRPSGRKVHAYLTVWSGPMPHGPLSSFYLDVF